MTIKKFSHSSNPWCEYKQKKKKNAKENNTQWQV